MLGLCLFPPFRDVFDSLSIIWFFLSDTFIPCIRLVNSLFAFDAAFAAVFAALDIILDADANAVLTADPDDGKLLL